MRKLIALLFLVGTPALACPPVGAPANYGVAQGSCATSTYSSVVAAPTVVAVPAYGVSSFQMVTPSVGGAYAGFNGFVGVSHGYSGFAGASRSHSGFVGVNRGFVGGNVVRQKSVQRSGGLRGRIFGNVSKSKTVTR